MSTIRSVATALPGPATPLGGGRLVALIPIRSLTGGKTRLAGALDGGERARLIRRMLGGVVAAAIDSGVVARVMVVSPEDDVLTLAADLHPAVVPLAQPADRPGLIAALDLGRERAVAGGAAGLLILFGDLPLLGAGDVRAMASSPADVVLSPDRHGEGTNALLLRLGREGGSAGDAAFRFRFGQDSYRRHLAEADRLGLTAATVVTAGTSLDVDTPADLAEWSHRAAPVGALAPDEAVGAATDGR